MATTGRLFEYTLSAQHQELVLVLRGFSPHSDSNLMDFGKYRVLQRLNESSLGTVYACARADTGEQVLLYVATSEVAAQLEAQPLQRLQEQLPWFQQLPIPGVSRLLDVGQLADGKIYVVAELVVGEPLTAFFTRSLGQLLEFGIQTGRQIARSLASAHAHGIVHGALTASQILLTEEGNPPSARAWLLGLGVADLLRDPGQTLNGLRDRGDVLALGTLLGELLNPLGATLPMTLTALLQQMTAAGAGDRPSMAEVANRLDAVLLPPPPGATLALNRAAADPHIGALFGNFRIVRKLGEGGMGVVYAAEHTKIGRRAAVKLLHADLAQDDQYAQRFLNEARAVNIIRHRGLVEIFEFGKLPDGTLFYVMEFLEGQSLAGRIAQRPAPFSQSAAVSLAVQMARALVAAHEKGIIHRDLKPANIMLEPDPINSGLDWVKILDFGIAKVRGGRSLGTDPEKTDVGTRVGAFMGTPLYMSPEQHGQAEQVDGKADVFSLGVVLYELLTKRLPFENNALSLLSITPPPVVKLNPAVAKRLSALIDRMMATRPSERPTMTEVTRQLTMMLPKPGLGRRLAVVTGAAGALLSAMVIFLLRMEHTPTPAELRNRARAVLAGYLQSTDDGMRVLAVRALGQSRDLDQRSLLVPLVQAKAKPELPALIEAAARALGQVGAMDAQPALLTLLSQNRLAAPGVQMAAAGALSQLQHPRGKETLRLLLTEGDDLSRAHAALLLLEQGDFSGAPLLRVSLMRGSLRDSERVQVLGRLALSGDTPARQLLTAELARLGSGEARVQTAYILARLGGSEGWAELKRVAAQPGPEQLLGLRLLAGLGAADGYAQLLQLAAARAQADSIRELAVAGLGDSGREDSLLVLAKMIEERGVSARLRIAAAGAVLQITAGERARLGEQTLSWARAALGSDSVATRELAVAVLGDLSLEEAIVPLAEALKDSERKIRKSAARALGHKNLRAALLALSGVIEDVDPEVRTTAMQSSGQLLQALGSRVDAESVKRMLTQLRRMTASANERDRVVAAGVLLQIHEAQPAELAVLRNGLSSADIQVRRLAIELAEPDRQALLQALADPDITVSSTAARRLAAQGSRDGVAVLRAVAARGDSEGLAAYGALHKLGAADAPPPGLEGLLSSGDLSTRLEVLDALTDLPVADALHLIQLALLDPSAVIRRRVAMMAASLYRKTQQANFLQMVHSLRNDPDVIVREQAMTLTDELAAAFKPAVGTQSEDSAAPVKPLPTQPLPHQEQVPTAAPESPIRGEILADGEELVRIQIDKNPPQPLNGKPISVLGGRHHISYLGGGQDVQVVPGQTVKVRIPVSLADQLLQDSKNALSRKDLQTAQDSLDRVRRMVQRGKAGPSVQADLAYQQAQLHESRQQVDAALTEYNRALNVPASQRGRALNAALQSAMNRLASKTGRIQIWTLVNGKCQITRELIAPPGAQTISIGKSQTRPVYVLVGSVINVKACQ